MPIYINRDNQQSGPYEDHVVLDQLRNGMLSPNDLGIRHGEVVWRRLGDMFPDVAPASPPVSAAAPPSSAVHLAGPPPKAAGGCRKPLGWSIFAIGLLLLLVGGLVAVATPFGYSTPSCDFADQDKLLVEKLLKEYERAKGTDEELSKKFEIDSAMAGYKASNDMCVKALSTKRMFQFGSIAVAIVGFFTMIIGFFIRRV